MAKLLADHRRFLGEFEVVDFVDEQEIAALRSKIDVDVPIACTYDLEVAAAKYFHALDAGDIPLLFLFSGTIFFAGDQRFSVAPVAWDKEAAYRLPVALWRELMNRYFPNSSWLRLRRENIDALHRFKGRRALTTFDDAVEALLAQAGEQELA